VKKISPSSVFNLRRFDFLLLALLTVFLPAARISGVAKKIGRAKEIYIAARTDGKAGSGTERDPFDGGTAVKFDTIMDGLAANTKVNLAAGSVFLTHGLKWSDNSKGWTVKDALYLSGNGATIKLIAYPNDWVANPGYGQKHVVIGNRYYEGAANNVVIENLTIDANWQNLSCPWTNKAVMCAFLYGSNNTYQRVRAINMYGDDASRTECFSLVFSAPSTSKASNCLAEDCVLESPRGGYQAGIAFFGWNDGTPVPDESKPMAHCRAVNNRFLGRFESGGVNLAFVNDIAITKNYFHNTQGVHHDTGAADKITIANNVFDQIYGFGVDFEMMTYVDRSDITIRGNIFRIPKSLVGAHTYGINMDSCGRLFSNVVIQGNSFVQKTTGKGSALWRAIHVRGLNGAVVADNTGDKGMEYLIAGTKISARNNHDFNGFALPDFPGSESTPTLSRQ
jgi:hypothetical protein